MELNFSNALSQKTLQTINKNNCYNNIRFNKLEISGKILNKQLLLDNKIYNKQAGYYVLTPVLLKNNSIILVNRGWISANNNRNNIPNITIPKKIPQNFSGIINNPSSGIVLKDTIEYLNNNIIRLQSVNFEIIAQQFNQSVLPFILKLDQNHHLTLQYTKTYLGITSTKHFGYAAQWFAFAVAAIIYLLVMSKLERKRK